MRQSLAPRHPAQTKTAAHRHVTGTACACASQRSPCTHRRSALLVSGVLPRAVRRAFSKATSQPTSFRMTTQLMTTFEICVTKRIQTERVRERCMASVPRQSSATERSLCLERLCQRAQEGRQAGRLRGATRASSSARGGLQHRTAPAQRCAWGRQRTVAGSRALRLRSARAASSQPPAAVRRFFLGGPPPPLLRGAPPPPPPWRLRCRSAHRA
jgi:hypothetical protein